MTGGISVHNMRRRGGYQRLMEYGCDALVPPADNEFVCPKTPLMDTTADADFPLAEPLRLLGNQLLWPSRLWVVLHNRKAGSAVLAPNIAQASPPFSGSDELYVIITGKLNGQVVTETIDIIGATTPTGDGDRQREVHISQYFYDEITSIRHRHIGGNGYGTTVPLLVSVGLAECALGEATHKGSRQQILSPINLPSTDQLRRGVLLTGEGEIAPLQEWTVFGTFTSQLGADTLTLASHGLANGTAVRVQAQAVNITDASGASTLATPAGLPGGLQPDTTYYVVATAANTLQLAASIGGAAIDLVAAAGYTDGDKVLVYTFTDRPRSWPVGGASQSQGNFVVDTTAETLTKTAHGLPNGTAIRLATAGSGVPGGTTATTTYFVISATANTIQIATTIGGSAVNLTSLNGSEVVVNKYEHRINVSNETDQLTVPNSVPPPFSMDMGLFSVQVAGDTLTKANHGLQNGMAVQLVGDAVNGVPGNTSERTTYYVVGVTGTSTSTLQLALTPGGVPIDLTAAGNFADGEVVRVYRPRHTWRKLRLIWSDGLSVG